MLRTQLLGLFVVSIVTLTSGLVIPERRQEGPSSSDPENVTPIATEYNLPALSSTVTSSASKVTFTSSTASSTPTPTGFDEGEEFIPPPDPDKSFFEDEGAQGNSQGFINVSIGAQAGIIIAIVLVGLGIMGGCIWFWKKKQHEWKAALERRRTLRASRIAAKKAGMPLTPGLAGANRKSGLGPDRAKSADSKVPDVPGGFGGAKKSSSGSSSSASTLVSTEVTVADTSTRSQFDVLTPTDEVDPWWRKVVPKKK